MIWTWVFAKINLIFHHVRLEALLGSLHSSYLHYVSCLYVTTFPSFKSSWREPCNLRPHTHLSCWFDDYQIKQNLCWLDVCQTYCQLDDFWSLGGPQDCSVPIPILKWIIDRNALPPSSLKNHPLMNIIHNIYFFLYLSNLPHMPYLSKCGLLKV